MLEDIFILQVYAISIYLGNNPNLMIGVIENIYVIMQLFLCYPEISEN